MFLMVSLYNEKKFKSFVAFSCSIIVTNALAAGRVKFSAIVWGFADFVIIKDAGYDAKIAFLWLENHLQSFQLI